MMMNDQEVEKFARGCFGSAVGNCAESMLLIGNARYDLGLPPEATRLVGCFGGGMGCGHLCGALAGAQAVLGCLKIDRYAHGSPRSRVLAAELTRRFEEKFGSALCHDVKPNFAQTKDRCLPVVLGAAEILEELLQEDARQN